MLPQLPMFKAFCTLCVLKPALSLILTKKVPMIENIIPIAAISIGNKIGDIPPKESVNAFVSLPNTIVAKTVAT